MCSYAYEARIAAVVMRLAVRRAAAAAVTKVHLQDLEGDEAEGKGEREEEGGVEAGSQAATSRKKAVTPTYKWERTKPGKCVNKISNGTSSV